jgi:UPF0716 protein FxsA
MTTGQTPRTPPKRSRARGLIPLGIVVWLVIEIWLLIVVGRVAGGITVLVLLVGAAVLGAVVMKRAGRRAFRNLTETVQQQQRQQQQHPGEPLPPGGGRGSTGNGFLMLGGLLIMLPGLLSDILGLLLLIPPVRKMLGRYAERSLERRMRAAPPGSLGDVFEQARMHQPDGKVVQGEVIRNDRRAQPQDHRGKGPRPPLTP